MSTIDLSYLEDSFTSAEEPEYSDVPDGRYTVRITGVSVTQTKQSFEPMFKWSMMILDGYNQGRHLWKTSLLRDTTLGFFKADLRKCGFEADTLAEVQRRKDEMLGTCLEVDAVTKEFKGKSIQNIYFIRRVDAPQQQEPARQPPTKPVSRGHEPPPHSDADLPF